MDQGLASPSHNRGAKKDRQTERADQRHQCEFMWDGNPYTKSLWGELPSYQ